jgi:hypothetical protein
VELFRSSRIRNDFRASFRHSFSSGNFSEIFFSGCCFSNMNSSVVVSETASVFIVSGYDFFIGCRFRDDFIIAVVVPEVTCSIIVVWALILKK